jgi:hypothetical protein
MAELAAQFVAVAELTLLVETIRTAILVVEVAAET